MMEAEQKRRKPGRPKGSTKGRSPRHFVSVMVTPELISRVDAAATERGLGRSAWIKEAMLYFLEHDPLSTRIIRRLLQESTRRRLS